MTVPAGTERVELEAEVTRLRDRFPDNPKKYLYILMAVGAVDAADRSILSTVMEDVKLAFDVSDSQLGLLGAAYALIATASAIPFGWLADRVNRVRLIALGFVPWAVSMLLVGASTSFGMMFASRLMLGSIEATNGPSTPSLLGDYYPVRERSRVFGIYGIGSLIGTLMGFGFAGVIASLLDWRASFYLWGLAGFVCGVVVIRTLPEPARGIPDALHRVEQRLAGLKGDVPDVEPEADALLSAADPTLDYRAISLGETISQLRRIPTMWIMFAANSSREFLTSGLYLWAPTFFRRYHDQSAAGGGIVVALLALSLVAGIIIGSRAGDRFMAEGKPQKRLWLGAGANAGVAVAFIPAFALPNFLMTIPFFLFGGFCLGLPQAAERAISLDIVVPHLRGRSHALLSVLRTGMTALAPLTFGVLSDGMGLRAAFLIVSPCMLGSAAITLIARRTYERDMERCQAESLRQHRLEEAARVNSPDN